MAAIAFSLPETRRDAPRHAGGVEWRVLAVSITLFLYSYGYGSLTSFVGLHAREHGAPEGLFFTAFALTLAVTRPLLGRFADRVGPRRLLPVCLVLAAAGLALLALSVGSASLVLAAVVFGTGFGTAYTTFFSHVMARIPPERRGAAFGAILAAFDTGIGTGSIVTGLVAAQCGIPAGFGLAALLAVLALPFFLFAEARWLAPELPRTR
jgi:MFS family permease